MEWHSNLNADFTVRCMTIGGEVISSFRTVRRFNREHVEFGHYSHANYASQDHWKIVGAYLDQKTVRPRLPPLISARISAIISARISAIISARISIGASPPISGP
jgi:hypothetical protein